MFENCKNTKTQGDIGLAIAIAEFVKMGWTVCVPLTDNQAYDLVIDDGISLKKVQVKTTRGRNREGTRWVVQLKTCGGNMTGHHKIKRFDPTMVGYLFIVTNDDQKYLIPCSSLTIGASLTLGKKYEQFKL